MNAAESKQLQAFRPLFSGSALSTGIGLLPASKDTEVFGSFPLFRRFKADSTTTEKEMLFLPYCC
jgi:hypothetical protein